MCCCVWCACVCVAVRIFDFSVNGLRRNLTPTLLLLPHCLVFSLLLPLIIFSLLFVYMRIDFMITHWRNIIDFQFCEDDVADDLHSFIGASLLKLCQLAKRSMRSDKAMCHVHHPQPQSSFLLTNV